ncbi:response regulator [Actinopolyspora saharensis]|uniref:Response regulator receiver domain-containing protein n=1 Tax=Actinopolyspora saharensis TaxID=995062 RepID=A0A1H1AFW2_9ACTN|nr:response regulator [Actinopolyspora saharensis]SDQ38574.1 Response regulator receiver domain-containing protein [Actinopolyspora saharensis]
MDRTPLILLAERDPYAADFTEHFLRTEGYEVNRVLSAEDALTSAAENPPDVVVVDLLISGANGQRLCSQLLERTRAAVIAISSLASAEAAYSVGAAAFLQKPIEPLELVTEVQKMLNPDAPYPEGKQP